MKGIRRIPSRGNAVHKANNMGDTLKAIPFYSDSHAVQYNAQGVDCFELLPGTHPELRAFKYHMKAGSYLMPDLYVDQSVLYIFSGKGKLVVKDETAIHDVNGVAFYVPNYEHCKYTIFAMTDAEFVQVQSHMDSHDWILKDRCSMTLPWFRTEEQCERYDQDCKTPGTISRSVIYGKFDRLGRLTCGICESYNGGTIEKGHPAVHQWDYALADACYTMTVGEGDNLQRIDRKAGDWDFIPAGPAHSLTCLEGQHMHYVWVELNVNKRGE